MSLISLLPPGQTEVSTPGGDVVKNLIPRQWSCQRWCHSELGLTYAVLCSDLNPVKGDRASRRTVRQSIWLIDGKASAAQFLSIIFRIMTRCKPLSGYVHAWFFCFWYVQKVMHYHDSRPRHWDHAKKNWRIYPQSVCFLLQKKWRKIINLLFRHAKYRWRSSDSCPILLLDPWMEMIFSK